MLFLEYLFRPESCATLVFYSLLTLAIFAMGCLSQRKIPGSNEIVFQYKWFLVAFAVLWALSFLGDIGTDYEKYKVVYLENPIELVFTDTRMEPGFRLLCFLLKLVIPNADIGMGVIKTITLVLLFYTVYRLRDKIHIGTAIGAYTALFYFDSFNLIRITLASVMVMLAFVLVLENKHWQALLLVLVTVTLHYTALLCLAILGVYYLTRKAKIRTLAIVFAAVLIPVFLILGLFSREIAIAFWQHPLLSKYSSYLAEESSSFGVMQFVFYAPVAAVFLFSKWNGDNDKRNLLPILALVGFGVAMMGYVVGMVSRFNIYFGINFMVLIPMFVHQVRLGNEPRKGGQSLFTVSSRYPLAYLGTMGVVIAYYGMRFVLDVGEYMVTSGIYPYSTWLF